MTAIVDAVDTIGGRTDHDHPGPLANVRRTREGRTKREIMRSLKRYISRQLFRTRNSAHSATSTT
ncbi:hypothetical protein ACFP2T_42610 [Plantactinospora solaniradicis]|uniref:IS110 family transposase n=1 Tax=Plantactinospora solaniradicis TaxID=1723736 RepID=A0ABW1KN11_9ACTN